MREEGRRRVGLGVIYGTINPILISCGLWICGRATNIGGSRRCDEEGVVD
jgi:hypothetical protein